mmetsp:Transcript_48548/g.117436  ORF Transcript_48548/g.117436 Transcript_48548/m.117436 type:complete len:313 (-) Transcript_48548:126-1064(-)
MCVSKHKPTNTIAQATPTVAPERLSQLVGLQVGGDHDLSTAPSILKKTNDQSCDTASSSGISSCSSRSSCSSCSTANTNSSSSDTKATRTPRVSFAPKVRVRRVMSRREYTDEEMASTWYTEDELQETSMSVCREVDMIDSGVVLRGQKYCSRGLEGHTRIGRSIKVAARNISFQTVLEEQDVQWDADVSEVEAERAIAESYARTTSASQLWAVIVGFRDARASQSCYEEQDIDNISIGLHSVDLGEEARVAGVAAAAAAAAGVDDDAGENGAPEFHGEEQPEQQKRAPDSKCTAISDLEEDSVSVLTARAA